MLPTRAARALPSTVELTVNLFKDSFTSDMMMGEVFVGEERGSWREACKDFTDSGTSEVNVDGSSGGVSDINSDWEAGREQEGFNSFSAFKLFVSEISGGLLTDFTVGIYVGLFAMRSMARLMGVEREAASLQDLHQPRGFGTHGLFLEQGSYLKPLWKVLLRNCLSASHM